VSLICQDLDSITVPEVIL